LKVFDVVIVGGGPASSTCGSYLRKLDPSLNVGIFERETFPREHVGESQLPILSGILHEIGAWDKVEAAGFPIKIGGTYRWGKSDDLWDFHFLPRGEFHEEPRPAKYTGQRIETAFQVDRSIYDKILLDHARDLGCSVYEGSAIKKVVVEEDKIIHLEVSSGEVVTARHYIDASGHSGVIRRALGVGIEEPSQLRNIAAWDYWQDAEWAVTLGNGGTRIQVMSLGYGWIWFIPIGPTRTSIGFVCPADYYKASGLSFEDLYLKAIQEEPRIRALVQNATREGNFQSTKDWSFVAQRMTGMNWMLIGEAAGFADPILSAGLSLAQMSAKEAAFTILELNRGGDAGWLKEAYDSSNRRKILQHIRFADYWYSANAHFSDLKEYTREIARDAGLELNAEQAFQWLGTGGFIEEDMQKAGLATLGISALHQVMDRFSEGKVVSQVDGLDALKLNLAGAERIDSPRYVDGRVQRVPTFYRDGKRIPMQGMFAFLVEAFGGTERIDVALTFVARKLRTLGGAYNQQVHFELIQAMEAMVRDGWLLPSHVPGANPISVNLLNADFIDTNHDEDLPDGQVSKSLINAAS
jgi:flavin-dependent dehydrogenase